MNLKTISKNALAALLVLWGPEAGAQTVGKYAGEFLTFGAGGRALGMGGAFTALSADASSGYWNPAGLARISYPEFMAMHDERFGGLINYDFGAAAFPSGADESYGVSFFRLGVDGIPDTRNAWIDNNGNGVFDNVDRLDYDKITYFNTADWALFGTYARRANADLMYGVNVKLIRREIAEFSATGIGFDAGVLYTPSENIVLGAVAQDVTTTLVAWSTGRNELITPTLKLGAAYSFDAFGGKFSPATDVDVRFENRRTASIWNVGPVSFDPRVGIEFDYKKTIALRGGYNDLKQFTVGAGIHLRKLDIDYSFARFGSKEDNLGDTHRISLRLILEEERFARSAE